MEDIEILEKILKPNYIDEYGLNNISVRVEQAIENLINRNKELEKENEILKKDFTDLCKLKNVIPKSKVKEKIEEIDKEIKDLTIRLCVRGSGKTIRTLQQTIKMEKRNMLQELLEKE